MSGGVDLVTCMDGLASAFLTVTWVSRAFGYPNEDAITGDAIVAYPEAIEFDLTFGRGADQPVVFPVLVICGLSKDSAARTYASALVKGAADIKDQVDGMSTISGASVRVARAGIERVLLHDLYHLSVRFDCEVIQ